MTNQRLQTIDDRLRVNETQLVQAQQDLNNASFANERRVNLRRVQIHTEVMFDLHNERKEIIASGMYLSISSN